jgi:hypothetical protein
VWSSTLGLQFNEDPGLGNGSPEEQAKSCANLIVSTDENFVAWTGLQQIWLRGVTACRLCHEPFAPATPILSREADLRCGHSRRPWSGRVPCLGDGEIDDGYDPRAFARAAEFEREKVLVQFV